MEIKLRYLTSKSCRYPIGDGDHGQIKPEQYLEQGIPYIRVQNISPDNGLLFDGMVYIDEKVNQKNRKSILKPGDILVAKTGATIGKACIVPNTITVANTTSSVGKISLDNSKADNTFVLYSIASDKTQNTMWEIASTKSAQPGFNIEDIKAFKIQSFPLDKQKTIGSFLSTKCNNIELAIKKENDSICLLKKYKQSLICQETNIGKKIKIKYISRLVMGATPETKNSMYWDGGIPWVTPADMINGTTISRGDRNISTLGYKNCAATIVPSGSVIMSTRAPIGTVVINDCELCFNQGCKGLIPNSNVVLGRFLFYSIMANSRNLAKLGRGTTFMELSSFDLANFVIKVPALTEQKNIINYLDKKCKFIDALVSLKERKIELLKSYKKSLIYECVTGKKEVPHA